MRVWCEVWDVCACCVWYIMAPLECPMANTCPSRTLTAFWMMASDARAYAMSSGRPAPKDPPLFHPGPGLVPHMTAMWYWFTSAM